MGNQSSQFGGMVVRTEKNVYMPGETVSGTIYIQLMNVFPGSLLTLKIKGKEDTKWITRHTRYEGQGQHRRAITTIKTHLGHSPFMNYKIPVFTWTGGMVPPGQYCIPFSFILPPRCPGTFNDTFNGGYAKLVYRLKAEMEPMNGMGSLKGECPLFIREAVNGVTGLIGDTQVPLTTCCCCSQGMAHLRCYVEKSAYTPGEMANVVLEVDNSKSNLPIKSLRCTLMWSLKVANSRQSHVISGSLADQMMAGLDAGQAAAGIMKRMFQIPVTAKTNFQGTEQGTTRGRFVQMSYSLRIYADMEGCTCCDAEPVVDVPITIYFPVPVIATPQAPSGWSPQMMPMSQLALGAQFEYQSRKVGKIVEEFEGEGDEPPHSGGGGANFSMNNTGTYGSPQGMGGGQQQMPSMAYPMNPNQQQPQMMVQYPQQNQMNGSQGYNNQMGGGYNNNGMQNPQMMQTNMMPQNGYNGYNGR